jgi:signal transduction histidine kinase/ligand-binding sensor domain-containing protein
MVQDRDGTLWIASEGGLYNFDGKTFTPFQSLPGDPALPSLNINSLYVSKNGSLWVGFAISGIAEIRDHRVVHLYGEKNGFPAGTVDQIGEAPDGTIMALPRDRLMALRSGHWESVPAAASLLGQDVSQFSFDRWGTLWVVTVSSIWRLPAGGPKFEKVSDEGTLVANFSQSPDGSLWAFIGNMTGGDNHLLRLTGNDNDSPPSWQIPVNGRGLIFDSHGAIWMATGYEGVLRLTAKNSASLDRRGASLEESFSSDIYKHSDGLSADATLFLMEDRSGDIWIATPLGIDRLRKPTLKRVVDKKIQYDAVLTQCPGGSLWLLDPGLPAVSIEDGKMIEHGRPFNPTSAHCDQTNAVWIPAREGLYVAKNSQIYHVPTPPGIDPSFTRQIVGDNEHQLYVSVTRNGLWRYTDGIWSRVSESGFPNDTPFSLFMDEKKRLWTGYIDGRVAMLDGHSGHIFAADSVNPLGIVQVFLQSNFGLLVGGSNGIAVVRGDHVQTLLNADEITAGGVSGLLQAKDGDLWLNGIHGITRIPADEVKRALASPDYRMHAELYSEAGITGPSPQALQIPSAVEDHSGIFWFATSDTVVTVDPNSIHPSTTPPIVSGLSITVDGVTLPANRQVRPGYHTIRIKYLGAYIAAPEKVTYRYKLDRADTAWQEVGDRSEAVYTGLRPGHYRFSVMASNGEGAWSTPDNSLEFTVLPSFYQRPSFLFLCAAATVGLLWALYQLRLHRLARQFNIRLDARVDERTRIARDLHDTLLQSFHGLLLHLQTASSLLPTRPEQAKQKLDATIDQAAQAITEGRDAVQHLRSSTIETNDLAAAIRAIGEDLSADGTNQNTAAFQVEVEGTPRNLHPILRDEIYRIACEALRNAFRHAQAGQIEVELRYDETQFRLRIRDNGKGIDPKVLVGDSNAGHYGLPGIRERAKLIGGKLSVWSELDSGTEVELSIPAAVAYATSLRRSWLSKKFSVTETETKAKS